MDMKKIGIKIAVLLCVFVMGVAGTAFFMNNENTDDTEDMDSPKLPVVMIDINGTQANRMFAYSQPMQVDFTRDSLTPLETSKKLTIAIKPFEAKINSLSYEVRTSDGSKVVENKTVKKFTQEDELQKAQIQLKSDMLMNQEYSLQITLDTNKGKAYYYTRVIQRASLNPGQYLSFVQNFYEQCMNQETSAELANYLETDEDIINNSYTSVDIHSSLSQVTWGTLRPKIYRKAVPVIKDINETTGSIVMDYQIAAKDTEGNQEIYDVHEFYRMRYTQARVMLLDFERSVQQVFNGELPVVDSEGVDLGIASKDIQYMTNSNGDVVGFVQAGDLWSYSSSSNKFTKIFSFRQSEGGDERSEYQAHDMKIVRLNEAGDMDFVLYGYMNRGPHEGMVGVSVCRYSNDRNVVEELAFIPSRESYEFLDKDLENLSYVNENNQLFLLIGGSLYQVDLKEDRFKVIQENIREDCFATSVTNGHVAWLDQMKPNNSTSITVMDFETLETKSIQAEAGQRLRVLGFMNEDLVYGITKDANVVKNGDGSVVFAMDTVKIQEFGGQVVKEYHQEGMYITKVTVGATLMEMELSAWENNAYVPKSTDNIMNNQKSKEETVSINLAVTERQGTTVKLAFGQTIKNTNPLVVYAKMRAMNKDHEIELKQEPVAAEQYYVYARGGLDGIYTNPAQAIRRADERTGVVLNRAQQYIWERGNLKTKIQIDLQDIAPAFLSASLDAQQLQKELGDGGTVLNLTGCTLENVLYEVSAQRPVIARTGENTAVVIVGYDEYNTLLYYPDTKEVKYFGMNDSTTLFQNAGNLFISYVEK